MPLRGDHQPADDPTPELIGERHLSDTPRRLPADRDRIALHATAADEWNRINRRPPEELAGLRRLMARPSPFLD